MSFSSKPSIPSPVERFYEWDSGEKAFTWYNKDTRENELLNLAAHLIVLDETFMIKGYSQRHKAGYTSNAISKWDYKKEKIRLRTYKSKQPNAPESYDKTAFWADLKDNLPNGAKPTINLYCMLLDKTNGNKLYCIQFIGGARGPVYEINKKGFDSKKNILVIKDGADKKENGEVTYYVPVLDFVDLQEGYVDEAIEMDEKLQKFFKEKEKEKENQSSSESEDEAVS